MSASIRDLLKTRRQRIGEVYSALHRGDGAFDVQLVSFGGDLAVGGTTTKWACSALEGVINGAIVNVAALANQTIPAGATTAAGVYRKVLLEVDSAGTAYQTVGTGVLSAQADAVKPKPTAGRLEIGWIEVPPSFTADTTVVTLGMLKKTPYWGSN